MFQNSWRSRRPSCPLSVAAVRWPRVAAGLPRGIPARPSLRSTASTIFHFPHFPPKISPRFLAQNPGQCSQMQPNAATFKIAIANLVIDKLCYEVLSAPLPAFLHPNRRSAVADRRLPALSALQPKPLHWPRLPHPPLIESLPWRTENSTHFDTFRHFSGSLRCERRDWLTHFRSPERVMHFSTPAMGRKRPECEASGPRRISKKIR
jgi:hypothetical protein